MPRRGVDKHPFGESGYAPGPMEYILIRRHPDGREEESHFSLHGDFLDTGREVRALGDETVWVVVEGPMSAGREHPVVVLEPRDGG